MDDANAARQPSLGRFLADLRRLKGLTLRQVEEATEAAVSNAYLSQIENGRVRKPSADVLYSLAEIYGVSYEDLMMRAGYIQPKACDRESEGRRLAAFATEELTPDEEAELLAYLQYYRDRKRGA